MADQYMRDVTLIIAGKDTSVLTWFFNMLCKYPFVQEKVAEEAREATEADNSTEAALEKMQYLHAALTETLRLYPAVPVVTSHMD